MQHLFPAASSYYTYTPPRNNSFVTRPIRWLATKLDGVSSYTQNGRDVMYDPLDAPGIDFSKIRLAFIRSEEGAASITKAVSERFLVERRSRSSPPSKTPPFSKPPSTLFASLLVRGEIEPLVVVVCVCHTTTEQGGRKRAA